MRVWLGGGGTEPIDVEPLWVGGGGGLFIRLSSIFSNISETTEPTDVEPLCVCMCRGRDEDLFGGPGSREQDGRQLADCNETWYVASRMPAQFGRLSFCMGKSEN